MLMIGEDVVAWVRCGDGEAWDDPVVLQELEWVANEEGGWRSLVALDGAKRC